VTTLFFGRREARFHTATVNSRGVWSYQIDGTLGPQFELTVFYTSPAGPSVSLGLFDSVGLAAQRAENHFLDQRVQA